MKDKLILMLGIVLLLLVSCSSVSANIIEQENSNTTLCTGTWDGTFPCSNVYDGDWATFGYAPNAGVYAYLYVNYTKINNAIGATWKIQDKEGQINLTIPADCYSYYTNVISFQVTSIGAAATATWACYNGSWTTLRTYSNTNVYIYEESVFWNTTLPPIITANTTTPDPALPTQDWQVNITATDNNNATFTAWTQFYINSTIHGGENTTAINNNTNTRIANLSAASIHDGDTLTAEVWVGDGETNTTKLNITTLADITYPTISPDNISLNKTFVYAGSNLTAQINASDENLYSINVSIGTTSIFNTSSYSSSLYVYNLSQNMSSFGAGLHNLSFRACDGHTSNKLKDKWDYSISLGSLTFKDGEKWYRINPTNSDLLESISTTKQIDRYSFKYSKSVLGKLLSGNKYTFVVESSEYIDIINKPDSKYNAWLVIPTIGSTGRWIDFNLKGVPDAKYVVKRLNNEQVEVTIKNIPKDIEELVFESTGELNCVTEYYEFYVFNYTLTHDLTVLETSNQSFVLEITRDTDYIDSANATLWWNGTAYTPANVTTNNSITFTQYITMPSVDADSYFSFNWTFNVTGNSTTKINTSNFNQTVYSINFDDCSTYNVTALNFSLIEESNNASIAGDMDFTFTLVGEAVTINYSKSVTGVNSTRFCISTNEVNFTAQLHSEYTATDYDAHTYFAFNLAIDNTVDYIYYYLTNGTTIVEFTVLDQSGNEIENAYIKVMKYDIGTGAYRTIEIIKTDELGKSLGNIILDTAWYKFMVEYEGTLYLDTSATKMTSTTRTFRINLLSDFFDRYTDVIYNIYSTLNYTDATGNFAFTYSDPNGNYHQGCLLVTHETLYGQKIIGETCVESTAATILVNVNSSNSVNGTYTAVGYILFDDMYVLNTLTKTWGDLSDIYGKEGFFYVFFIVLVCVMVGIFSPKLAVILGIIGLVFSNILGFIFIEWGWLVSIIIAAGLTLYRMRDM